MLPDQYGQVLEAGQLQLELIDGAVRLRCEGAGLPICPESYPRILTHRLEDLASRLGEDHVHLRELRSILTSLTHLPDRGDADPARVDERLREKDVVKRRLAALLKESADIRDFVDDNLRAFNGRLGEAASFDLLDSLLFEQTYRLADWRVAGDEVNYRRFFDINHLAAIRMERPEVFAESHQLVLRLVAEGKVAGIRVDHPDGLYGPGEYFRRLQEGAILATARRLHPDLDPATAFAVAAEYRATVAADPGNATARPLWIAAEKILTPDEPLPEWWPVAGTTGYDFLDSVNGIFVDRSTSRQLTAAYSRFAGNTEPMAELSYSAKRLIMQVSMASEITQLGLALDRISERNRLSRDFTLANLIRAIREVIAAFAVYRTYIGDLGDEPSSRDRACIDRALAEAKRRNPTMSASIFEFLRDALLLRHPPRSDESARAERRHFTMRFQQTTGPVTAKGVEDTALYRYHRLVSLNEVGGDPARYGEPVASFHEKNARRRERWPDSLACTSTHDTKRGEDVRARISVLSEIPEVWVSHVRRWRTINRRFKRDVDGRSAPDRNDEYLLYQTLVGAWPARDDDESAETLVNRISEYMEKAAKEAKRRTSWINPDAGYDQALRTFVGGLLSAGSRVPRGLHAVPAPRGPLRFGQLPGADRPQDRRPRHSRFLPGLRAVGSGPGRPRQSPAGGLRSATDAARGYEGAHRGAPRRSGVRVRRALRFLARRSRQDVRDPSRIDAPAATSDAVPLRPLRGPVGGGGARGAYRGPGAGDDTNSVVMVVPRLTARLTAFGGRYPLGDSVWGDTRIVLDRPGLEGIYTDRFSALHLATGRRNGTPTLPVAALLARFPVAMLRREATP